MTTPPDVARNADESCNQEQETNPLCKIWEGLDDVALSHFTVDQHVGWRGPVEEREVFFLHCELHEGASTRRVGGDLTEVGGSGRSQVGGTPALRGVKGADLLIRFASLMIIIQLLQLHTPSISCTDYA